MKKAALIVTVISAAAMIGLIVVASFFPVSDEVKALRYLKEMGWLTSDDSPEITYIKVPEVFDDMYDEYNEIQNLAGYDLLPYSGVTVTKYTFDISNFDSRDNVVINILMHNSKIIGGDITNVNVEHGFVIPLQKNDM